MIKKFSYDSGFTLIELLLVVSLAAMIMLTISSMLMTFLIGNAKTSTAQLVKREGDYTMGQIEFLLRNATALDECTTSDTSVTITSRDGGTTVLTQLTDTDNLKRVGSNSAYLTSQDITLVSGPTFNCTQSPDGAGTYVGVTFQLRKGSPSVDKARDIVEQTFSSGVTIRNL
jgi:prepilin-type N-terminal cleavage/methylation domain-containing protein